MSDEQIRELQKRIESQLQRANGEVLKKQQEYEEERKSMDAINEDELDSAQFIRRMSKGARGYK